MKKNSQNHIEEKQLRDSINYLEQATFYLKISIVFGIISGFFNVLAIVLKFFSN